MPLAKGKSNKAVSKNIQTLVDDYQKSGRIGTSKPANKKAAVKQATAIALQKAGRSKPKATMAKGGKVRRYATGGSINEPTNYLVAPGTTYEQQYAEDVKEKARAQAQAEPRDTETGIYQSQSARDREAAEERVRRAVAPSTNMPGSPEATYQGMRRTRPNVKFFAENFDVSKPLGTKAMKKGGKVSVKKRRA